MENIKQIIANNLVLLRKEKKYTQQQLAERLNYSDKAVSRWEHAETLPDIETLCKICDIYGVTFEYLLQKEQPKKNNPYIKSKSDTINKIVVMLIGAVSVWIAAIVAYVYMHTILGLNVWTLFIWAIPLTSIVVQVSNKHFFGNNSLKYILSSITQWTLILSIYLQLIEYNIWLLFILGIPIQIIIILLAILKASKKRS